MKRLLLMTSLIFGMASHSALAIDSADGLEDVLENELSTWVNEPVVLTAIRAQNSRNSELTDAEVVALDDTWRSEVGNSETPFQSEIMARAVSEYLVGKQSESNGIVSEVFVMDRLGLNVGQSGLTSDYWQGDETKFQESFGKGAGSIHIGEVELDESTGAYLVQISSAISDPTNGELIGAVTFGINIGLLE